MGAARVLRRRSLRLRRNAPGARPLGNRRAHARDAAQGRFAYAAKLGHPHRHRLRALSNAGRDRARAAARGQAARPAPGSSARPAALRHRVRDRPRPARSAPRPIARSLSRGGPRLALGRREHELGEPRSRAEPSRRTCSSPSRRSCRLTIFSGATRPRSGWCSPAGAAWRAISRCSTRGCPGTSSSRA